MKTLAVIGANGFVGSAFVRQATGYEVTAITRDNYARFAGCRFDVVVDASGNSRKYLAEEDPARDFDLTVRHRLTTLLDFPESVHIHVSSVDVYADLTSPETTREDSPIDRSRQSVYGFHKLLAEELVQKYARSWLVVRLAGMVGPGLRKNPVYDILHGLPLRIHPDSQYQFMETGVAAARTFKLLESGGLGRVVNVCGRGLISPREISALAGRPIVPSAGAEYGGLEPRIVDVNVALLTSFQEVEETRDTIAGYLTRG